MAYITLTEYARKHGRSPATARQRLARGCFPTARMSGGVWLIDENEPWEDGRIKNGKYTGLRKKKKAEP